MHIVYVKPTELKPADYNPRQMTEVQARQLADSITRFGIVDPIIANKHEGRENIVIGGHQRLRTAIQLGIELVPVHYVDLDLEKEKELNLRLNHSSGEFDWDVLANNFDTDFLMEIGFTETELGLADRPKAGKVRISLRVSEGEAENVVSKINQALAGIDFEIRIKRV